MCEIRRMTMEDISQVHQIECDTFATPWSLQSFEKELRENKCARYLVAVADRQIVGYGGEWLILDEGHITNIAVAQAYRQKGIGRRILQGLMQYASNLGVGYLTLEVRASNAPAQHLYKSMGFMRVSIRKKYYEDNGEDGWLMVCDKMPAPQEDFAEDETLFVEE